MMPEPHEPEWTEAHQQASEPSEREIALLKARDALKARLDALAPVLEAVGRHVKAYSEVAHLSTRDRTVMERIAASEEVLATARAAGLGEEGDRHWAGRCDGCGETVPGSDELVECPACGVRKCTTRCIAGRGVRCFECEEGGEHDG